MNQKPLIVWVTGGSRGIGKAICSTLAQAGMTVIFNYSHDEVAAGKTVNEIRKNNGTIEALKGSVTDEQEMNSLCHYIIDKYGRLD
ncbi:MAG: SDR family NAD(P)-dependent oxidoreductase, partial [Spirochaetaceae bacterium]|nr:SDR family NAD(P)-dependent oxidoreductase [Spirochaetaceae bacterium]